MTEPTEPRPARGSYAKGRARRTQIVNAAIDVFGSQGFRSGSLREIAKRVGLTTTGLMHHFSSKEELFAAVLRARDAQVRAAAGDVTESTLVEQMRRVVAVNQRSPGLSSVYTVVAAEATDAEHPAHDEFRDRYAAQARSTEAVIRDAQRDGLVRDDLDAAHAARLLAAVMDGLQQQRLLDDSVDAVAAFDEFLRGYLLPR